MRMMTFFWRGVGSVPWHFCTQLGFRCINLGNALAVVSTGWSVIEPVAIKVMVLIDWICSVPTRCIPHDLSPLFLRPSWELGVSIAFPRYSLESRIILLDYTFLHLQFLLSFVMSVCGDSSTLGNLRTHYCPSVRAKGCSKFIAMWDDHPNCTSYRCLTPDPRWGILWLPSLCRLAQRCSPVFPQQESLL